MAETLLWSDDFNYPNKPALDAAYPYYGDSGVTGVAPAIELVNPGMAGYLTGIDSKGSSEDFGAGIDVSQWMINPTGKCFHFRGVYKQDGVDLFNSTQLLVGMGQVPADGSDFYGHYWQLNIRNESGGGDLTELQLTVRGGNGTIGSYPSAAYSTGYVPGILTPNAPNEIDVSGNLSTLTEPSPGVFVAAADGNVTVKVNGVTVFTWIGVVWNFLNPTALPKWNYFEMHPCGTMSGLRIWECDSAAVVDDSDACSCTPLDADTAAAGGGTGAGASANQYPTIGAQIACVGGGLVPTQADLTYSEVWWGN